MVDGIDGRVGVPKNLFGVLLNLGLADNVDQGFDDLVPERQKLAGLVPSGKGRFPRVAP